MVARGKSCQMKRTGLALLFALILLIGLAGAALTFAAEGGGHGEGAGLDLLARFINFALLVIILAVVLKKSNALGFFSDRVEEIKTRMERLQQEKEEAEAKYREMQQKLTDFESEKKKILEEARSDGEAEKARIISDAEKRVAQMLEQVESAVRQEMEEAKSRLREEVAEQAADKAREIIARELSEDDQDRLVNEFIERVGKVH